MAQIPKVMIEISVVKTSSVDYSYIFTLVLIIIVEIHSSFFKRFAIYLTVKKQFEQYFIFV